MARKDFLTPSSINTMNLVELCTQLGDVAKTGAADGRGEIGVRSAKLTFTATQRLENLLCKSLANKNAVTH